jgi:hypothetical protein
MQGRGVTWRAKATAGNRVGTAMMRVSIPSFLLLLAVTGAALTSLASFQLATAHADMVVPEPIELTIAGSASGNTLVYRITNPGREAVEVAQPHLVVLDRGVRLPLRITGVQLDGASRSVHDAFTIAPGQTVTLMLSLEAARRGDVELTFYRGNVRAHRMTV